MARIVVACGLMTRNTGDTMSVSNSFVKGRSNIIRLSERISVYQALRSKWQVFGRFADGGGVRGAFQAFVMDMRV